MRICNSTATSFIYSVPNARHVPSSLALTTISPSFPSAAPLIGSWCPLCSRTREPARTSHVRRVWSAEEEMTRCGFVGCTNRLVTASCKPAAIAHQQEVQENSRTRLTLCSSVVRNRLVLRSQIHTLPSVAPVTTVFVLVDPTGALAPSTAATMLTKAMASTLSPSVWPPSAEMTSPLLRLMTRTPPSAPPTTASVEAGLMASDVMPPKLNRASSPVSLKTGVGERGSQ
jgi:hypothetical protein